MELRWSSNGASTSVGSTAAEVGDFTQLLVSVNPGLAVDGYPSTWTAFIGTLSGLGGPTSGRFAFRYTVPDTSVNADYIGIDTVTVVPEVVTLPTLAMCGVAMLGLALRRSVGAKR